ncbi:hypothetical protein EDD16DRAFT_1062056 [Pisolithus croceorrhizus]|nr:hypothetical protein EV401DRAFT_1056135 [Pisolithus croceorrhizus]KAI6115685.1 hypothetical protein EDD16DRAFT_1062056 [Pisolithus croceorrhizus]KAI6148956.1 hypothetical protein EDD17DRAFT_1225511 [Pisolithus thermaeus]
MSIRLLHLSSRSISSHPIDSIRWDTVWDNQETHLLQGVTGCTWSSAAFSSPNRFLTILVRVSSLVSQHKGEYIWMDAICIDQDSDEDKREQIPHMVKIFRDSAGTITFGKLTPDDEFSELVYTYDTEDGEKHGLTFGLSGCRITKNSGSPEKSSSCPVRRCSLGRRSTMPSSSCLHSSARRTNNSRLNLCSMGCRRSQSSAGEFVPEFNRRG